MRKFFVFLVAILALAGCSKEGTGVSGTWKSSTSDGVLFLELNSGGNGVAYFEGCPSSSAFWSTEGKTIKIIGHAYNKSSKLYNFGSGTVDGGLMRIEATVSKAYSSDKTVNLTFSKQ